ncbi:MAG: hypothetical protein ACHQ1H_11380 [Nitrososphaerales archaeon]
MNDEIILLALTAILNLTFAVWNARAARDFAETTGKFISKFPKYLALILSAVAAHSIATVILVVATLSGFSQDSRIENLILNTNVALSLTCHTENYNDIVTYVVLLPDPYDY